MFKSYINPTEAKEANRKLPKLMVEGLLMGGTGLGVLALIFEIAADAFSVAAYQTLLAIHGAAGQHRIAIIAFIVLSILLFLGIVPAYKAGSYLRPNAGGSGPLVEAIGPKKMAWLSWGGTSLFFIDAILTIIISSISAADVTMLMLPQLVPFRILLAEFYAFFIMGVLVMMGPKKAVPIFLIGGGAFTIFTLGALTTVGWAATVNPEWAFLTNGIVARLQASGVVENVIRMQGDAAAIGSVLFFQLFFRSMSSAMLGFSGYEVIPASGKHAARPKWKVINTALTLAALFLISTGVFQLYAAQQWDIPATEGYSTLLIEYEIISAQTFGEGINPDSITYTPEDLLAAEELIQESGLTENPETVAYNLALGRTIKQATDNTRGGSFLIIAGILLAIILLLAQGGGYIGGAAVAANAARLGRLPSIFLNDRNGIAIIWIISAILIPFIKEVIVVEAYYAFGFVSAFVITSTTVFFVRDDALQKRGITPGSAEAKSLKFAGLRGMIASYIMLIVLIVEKTDALTTIVIAGGLITIFQVLVARGTGKKQALAGTASLSPGTPNVTYTNGTQRARDQARQRGIADAVIELIEEDAIRKFNVGPDRIYPLVCYTYNIPTALFEEKEHHEHIEEPNQELEAVYQDAYNQKQTILDTIESYSHFGIFRFIHNYHPNWVSESVGRDAKVVQQAMLTMMFPQTPFEQIWEEWNRFEPIFQPEAIWRFSRRRYEWAKDQWPNLSDRITTIWTLQDFGLIPADIEVTTTISVEAGREFVRVNIPSQDQLPTQQASDYLDTRIDDALNFEDDLDDEL